MRFQCPLCAGIVAVDNSALGIKVQCGHCSGVIDVPVSRIAPGAIIADFIIQKELGRGGMGVVYLAHQISLDRPSALKILSENYANDAQFVGNFIKEARAAAMQVATLYATEVPLRTMKAAYKAFDVVRAMATEGNPNSVSDAGVGALAARSAVMGACLNVKINAAGLKDRETAERFINEANEIQALAQQAEKEILEIVESKIN